MRSRGAGSVPSRLSDGLDPVVRRLPTV